MIMIVSNIGVAQLNNSDYFSLLVSNYILGGDFSSVLMRSIREKYGLTSGVYNRLLALTQHGRFAV